MAKLSFTIAVFLLLLAVSRADPPEKDDATGGDLWEPSTTATILLPSEDPGYEAATLVQFDHDESDSEPAHHSDHKRGTVPWTSVSFHPINRHFPRGHVPLRRRHRFHHRDSSHDVTRSRERWGFAFDPEIRGPTRRVPGKPGFGHKELTWEAHVKKPQLHRIVERAEHGDGSEYHGQRHQDMARKEAEDGGPFMKIRKFLGLF